MATALRRTRFSSSNWALRRRRSSSGAGGVGFSDTGRGDPISLGNISDKTPGQDETNALNFESFLVPVDTTEWADVFSLLLHLLRDFFAISSKKIVNNVICDAIFLGNAVFRFPAQIFPYHAALKL